MKYLAQQSTKLAAILELVEGIPQELLVLRPEDYARFVCCTSAIRSALRQWESGSAVNAIKLVDPIANLDVVVSLRRLVNSLPDAYPAPETSALGFIEDTEYRATLRLDLNDAERATSNGEWKAATVLCGSILEALLLWAVRARPEGLAPCVKALKSREVLKLRDSVDPERWSLFVLVHAAHELRLISDETRTLILLAKDFRNLIHPGKTARVAMRCDRGTALAGLAATEFLVRELTQSAKSLVDDRVPAQDRDELNRSERG